MFKKILLPSDGSDYALRAAVYAVDIAQKYESHVDIVYVVEMPPAMGIKTPSDSRAVIQEELVSEGNDALQKTKAIFDNAGVQVYTQIHIGSAVPVILRLAREGEYDLMVIGSRGSGTTAIDQILIGSVAEGILHGASCPVLMVRPIIEKI